MASPIARYQEALQDFRQARHRAALQRVLSRMTGKSSDLMSYDDVVRKLKLSARAERGIVSIPIDAIVGSVNRYDDFSRSFLPLRDFDRERWARVRTALTNPEGPGLPPIDVYQIGQVYFVLDGNHRVSVARQIGMQYIEANVIMVYTDIPLTPDTQPDDLIAKAEYADFLAQTHLTSLRPNVNLSVTVPGQYEKLKEQILVHQHQLEERGHAPVGDTQAVEDWYDQVYTPVASAIHEQGLLRWFPNRTETDLYLWITEHQAALQQELGWSVRPAAAISDLALRANPRAENLETAPGHWRQTKLIDRYLDRLFADILVPLDGAPDSWRALEQALVVAQYEQAEVHGLYVVPSDRDKSGSAASALRDEFLRKCDAAHIMGNLTIEAGNIARKICERALLTDLVVLHLAHPPAAGWSSLRSGWRTILRRSARPVLVVPTEVRPFKHALVAFDGSPQSKQALFVATYLAEKWKTRLEILIGCDPHEVVPSGHDTRASLGHDTRASTMREYAQDYLELHEIKADYAVGAGLAVWLECAQSCNVDLMLMGGSNTSLLEQALARSSVDSMLRQAQCPLLLCR